MNPCSSEAQRILVTGANGDIAGAIGRVINMAFPNAKLLGVDLGESWPGKLIFSEMHVLPRADAAEYTSALRHLAEATEATCIIPCTEPELGRLVADFSDTEDLPLLMNAPEVIDVGLDKLKTMEWLDSIGVATPGSGLLEQMAVCDLPLFVKPRNGYGSRDLAVVRTASHLSLLQQERCGGEFIAQALLEPHQGEYTCALFQYGDEMRGLVMRRWLRGGLTGRMVVERVPAIDTLLQTIAVALPAWAAINVQLRMTPTGPKVFEINPRLSSTVMMRHKVGFCDLVWWMSARHGVAPPAFSAPVGTRVYRTYDEVVVPSAEVGN